LDIRLTCDHNSDPFNTIYYNQKCINLSKRHGLKKPLIHVLIAMGACFDKITNSNDLLLSMSFQEKAKQLVKMI